MYRAAKMNSLRSAFTITVIFSFALHYVQATELIDDLEKIKEYLERENSEDHYGMSVTNPDGRRLSRRNSNNVRAQCDQARNELEQLGSVGPEVSANLEKFPKEDAANLVNYEFMELPIEGMQNKTRKVVRLTDKPFSKTKNESGNKLETPVEFPNGLFIADSGFNQNMIYLFTKTPGSDTLLPVAILPCVAKIVEIENEYFDGAPDGSAEETA